jgi:hypothetical protein
MGQLDAWMILETSLAPFFSCHAARLDYYSAIIEIRSLLQETLLATLGPKRSFLETTFRKVGFICRMDHVQGVTS